MCIILVGNKQAIERQDLPRLWARNPHGAGIVYLKDRKVTCIKGIMSLKGLENTLNKLHGDLQIVLHLRLATHGSITRDNTHPHRCGSGFLVHNGVLSYFGRSGIGKGSISDSRDLADTIKDLSLESKIKLLSSLHGKFCLVTSKGIEIVRPEEWIEHDGILASNNSITERSISHYWQDREFILGDWRLPE